MKHRKTRALPQVEKEGLWSSRLPVKNRKRMLPIIAAS